MRAPPDPWAHTLHRPASDRGASTLRRRRAVAKLLFGPIIHPKACWRLRFERSQRFRDAAVRFGSDRSSERGAMNAPYLTRRLLSLPENLSWFRVSFELRGSVMRLVLLALAVFSGAASLLRARPPLGSSGLQGAATGGAGAPRRRRVSSSRSGSRSTDRGATTSASTRENGSAGSTAGASSRILRERRGRCRSRSTTRTAS